MSTVILAGNLISNITGGVFYSTTSVREVVGSDVLTASPASIMAAYIIDELAKMTTPSDMGDWPLYKSSMPDGKNVETDCGVIYDTTPVIEQRLMSGLVPQHPGIQLRIRSRKYEIGYAKIEDVAVALDAIDHETVSIAAGDFVIQNANKSTAVVPLGLEVGTTKRRFLFTVNFLLTVKKLP